MGRFLFWVNYCSFVLSHGIYVVFSFYFVCFGCRVGGVTEYLAMRIGVITYPTLPYIYFVYIQ